MLSDARGLLHPGDILLLDEISSSLDEETERELYHRLFITFPEKTMLFITHRATITELCDEVIMLAGGSVLATAQTILHRFSNK